MKMKEILQTTIYQNAKIVAGEDGLNRNVESVNMMDAPDIIGFLKPNELLLTTAYFIHDNPHEMVHLVKEMAKKQCSGLGIKTRRFLNEIPSSVIQAANDENFPIIELPFEISLGDMVNETLSYILEKRTNELQFALKTHREFTNLIHKGEQLSKIIENLSSLLQKPVLMLNHIHNITVQSHHFRSDDMKEMVNHLLSDIDFSNVSSKNNMISYSVFQPKKLRYTTNYLFPIETYYRRSYLIICGLDYPLDAYTLLTIEQVANVISFDLLKQHALSENTLHFKNSFFNSVLDNEVPFDEVISRGKEYGLKSDKSYIVVSCKKDEEKDNKSFVSSLQLESHKHTIYEHLDHKLTQLMKNYIIFTKKDLYIILYEIDIYDKQNEQKLIELLSVLQKEMSTHLNVDLSFGMGSYAEKTADIPTSFRHSFDALETTYHSGKNKFIQPYRSKDITELLRMIPLENLKEFYDRSLKGIAYSTNKDTLTLIQTLSVYLDNQSQIAETAKQLFVHRNTVIYRLEKCEELLGISLKEPDETLKLRIALLIRTLLFEDKQNNFV